MKNFNAEAYGKTQSNGYQDGMMPEYRSGFNKSGIEHKPQGDEPDKIDDNIPQRAGVEP